MTSLDAPSRQVQDGPLSRAVAGQIRRTLVLPGEAGVKLPTEQQLSGRLGVSVRTVREALTTLLHDGLVERRHGSGTYIRDFRESQYVAVLIGSGLALPSSSSPNLAIAQHLLDWLADHKRRGAAVTRHHATFTPTRSSQFQNPRLVRDLDRGLVSCIVSLSANPHPSWQDLARELGVPIVGLSRRFDYSVGHDAVGAVERGLRHLIERGVKRVAPVVWRDRSMAGSKREVDRVVDRLLEVGRETGCEIDTHGIRSDLHPMEAGAGYQIVKQILGAGPRPDALMFNDDHYYRAGVFALAERRIAVPQRMRLLSIAHRGSEQFYPYPTDVLEFDPQQVGVTLGRLVDDLLKREPVETPHVRLPVQLLPNQCSLSPRSGGEEPKTPLSTPNA